MSLILLSYTGVLLAVANIAATSISTDSISPRLYFKSRNEMGIWQCTLDLHTNEFPALMGKIRPAKFNLGIWMRYMMPAPLESSRPEIKALAFAEPLDDSFKFRDSSQTLPHSISIDPKLELRYLLPVLALSSDAITPTISGSSSPAEASNRPKATMNLTMEVKFQITPINDDALPFASMSPRIPLDPAWAAASEHKYILTALGGGPGKECSFKPLELLLSSKQLFPKGLEESFLLKGGNITHGYNGHAHMPFQQAVVIAKPIWPMNANNMALIDRHIQHYAMLGFSRCEHCSVVGTSVRDI